MSERKLDLRNPADFVFVMRDSKKAEQARKKYPLKDGYNSWHEMNITALRSALEHACDHIDTLNARLELAENELKELYRLSILQITPHERWEKMAERLTAYQKVGEG